jgi:preprotein translocase subunit SecG
MQVLNIFHVLIAIALIAFVLIQKGQGATAGAAFGSGASGTVFGARGAGNFLSRSTWVLATLFCAISLTMAVVVSRMMTETPQADLGVVATLQEETQSDTPPVQELSLGPDESAPVDIPAFQPAAEDQSALDGAPTGASDDLPTVEDADKPAEPAADEG